MSFDGSITEPRNDSSLSTIADAARRVGNDRVKRKGEREIIRRVLDEIDVISVKRMSEGFNQWNFSFGVFNCFFIVYVFGKLSHSVYTCVVISYFLIELLLTFVRTSLHTQ